MQQLLILQYVQQVIRLKLVLLTDGFVGFYNATSKTIQIESKLEPIEKVSIFNITGQLIGSCENQSNSFSTDVSNYPSGIYIVTATANGKIQSFKILKQ